MSGEPIRVAVVDDHPVFRLGMTALLASTPGLVVVGEAADADGALRVAGLHRPDVIIMDLHLGGRSGVEATREIVAGHPGIGVLVVTMLDDDDWVFAALRAGARGYLLKGAAPAEVERAVRAVANGEVLLGPSLSPKTVRNHLSNVLTKLQVADRSQAIVRAREAGLGQP